MSKTILSFLFLSLLLSSGVSAQGVEPFVPVSWGQSAPYNDACPAVNGEATAPGCVAVAIAHAMSAYRSPSSPRGSVSYATSTHKLPLSVDFASFPLDWELLLAGDMPSVSSFLYTCGAAAHMDFCPITSTTPMSRELTALIEHYGYDPDMVFRSRLCYSAESWHRILQDELDHHRPVIINATDRVYGAHAFVIDGYMYPSDGPSASLSVRGPVSFPAHDAASDVAPDAGSGAPVPAAQYADGTLSDSDAPLRPLYHVVWGWGGKDDGYYDIDRLTPDIYTFDTDIRAVTGIQPDDNRQTVQCCLEAENTLSATEANAGDEIIIDTRIYNRSYRTYSGYFTVMLTGPDGQQTVAGRRRFVQNIQTNTYTTTTMSFAAPAVPGQYALSVVLTPLLTSLAVPAAVSGDLTLSVRDSGTGIEAPSCGSDGSVSGSGSASAFGPDAASSSSASHLSSPCFSLSGQRVSTRWRGIVIRNGRKEYRSR